MQKFNKENLETNSKNQYYDDNVNEEQLKYPIDATSDQNLIENNDSLDKNSSTESNDVNSSVNTISEENQSDANDDSSFCHYRPSLNTLSSNIETDIESESACKTSANIYDDDLPNCFEENRLNTKFSEELSCEKKMFIEKNICKLRSRIEVDKSKLLGRGAFGEVYKCIDLETSEEMAVKIFNQKKLKDFDELSFIKQHEIMQQIEHENIMKLLGHKKVDDIPWSFMEYCPDYVSLSKLLRLLKEQEQDFDEESFCAFILRQVLEALHTMHENNIMHRDIKADNVLVNVKDFTVKLCDFDFVIQLPNHDSYVNGPMGTYSHMAPEMLCNETNGYTFSADIYSFGCLMLEMLQNGNSPWCDEYGIPLDEHRIVFQVGMQKKRPPYPDGLSEMAIDFLNKCLEINPQKRASALDLLHHPFLNS